MWTCRIPSLRGNAVGWGSSATRFEHKHFYQLFATHMLSPPLLHVHPEVPVGQSSAVPGTAGEATAGAEPLGISQCADVSHSGTSLLPPAHTSKMWVNGAGVAQKRVSGGVIRVCWQAASSVGAILHSLFSTGLKGKPPFALSLYSPRWAAGASLPLPRPLMNSWLEILI